MSILCIHTVEDPIRSDPSGVEWMNHVVTSPFLGLRAADVMLVQLSILTGLVFEYEHASRPS